MEGNIVENVKNVASKVSNGVKNGIKGIKKIGKAFKFFIFNPIGQVIGVIVLALFLIVVVYVISDVVQHRIGIWFKEDYAGISTYDDWDTIVGALGYSGYDSFISEEKWQEYAAFEYAVLMDVAEYMYDNQNFITTLDNPNGGTYDTSAVIPEGIVHTEYDAATLDGNPDAWWKTMVPRAQGGSAPSKAEIGNSTDLQLPGGNRDVVRPWLIYEKANHEYEDEAISLMPYLVVVREDIELNYFLQGLTENQWKKEYSGNLEDVKVEHLEDAASGDELAPVEFSPILNRFNYNMPSSAYKEDLKEYQQEKLNDKNNSGEVVADEDKEGILKADEEKGYKSDSIYYIEQETDIVYKIPLKLLVNRYLPKSTLLTAWYMLKKDDEEGKFKIDEMMEDIKEIYNAACYEQSSISVPTIEVTKKINDQGVIVEEFTEDDLKKLPSDKTIRVKEANDKFEKETVDSVQYDDFGAIIRNESGEAEMTTRDIEFATSNYRTFIYFEQFGLETSRYENYKIYLGPSGDNDPFSGDEARPEEEAPSATYLTQKRVNFIQTMNMHLSNIRYKAWSGDELVEKITDIDPKLKTAYSHAEEMEKQKGDEYQVELSEKLKSLYTFKDVKTSDGNDPKSDVKILQSDPYALMKVVVQEYESSVGDPTIKDKTENGGATHHFINKLYIMAEPYNYNELLEDAGGDIIKINQDDVEGYRLAEDYRYYNQDDEMPHWYDLTGEFGIDQETFEEDYLKAFRSVYREDEGLAKQMLLAEIPDAVEIIDYGKTDEEVKYTYSGDLAPIYSESGSKHNSDMEDPYTGNYQINYYWDAVYTIEEKTLQMRQAIHHRRMPAVLVKYCDSWAKSTEYNNYILQNPLDYRNYVYLIPNSVTSLGLQKMQLNEKSSFRVETFKDYFNKSNNGDAGIKEGDVLDMLIQWEDYANKGGDETTYAYMRDLYKLALFIRDDGQMFESAYTYLYIPSTISNYDDETLQKIFWLERLGVTQGEDELTEEEQEKMRLKAITTRWQNLEYDEYYECVYDVGVGDEDAKIYALFPFGSSYIRSYVMLAGFDSIIGQKYKGAAHPAIDTTSRTTLKAILNAPRRRGK